ncbi:MAG: hypothetical protein AAFV78_11825 [Bacteroidota bacterium]
MKYVGFFLLIWAPLWTWAQSAPLALQLFPQQVENQLQTTIALDTLGHIQPSQTIDHWELDQWRQSYPIMPGYARDNPAGHAYLCRLELKTENTLPIGIWVKVADPKELLPTQIPHTYLRMKLLRF